MRIAITNDDGIHGEGLLQLVRWAQKLGEVTVFAPKYEQSGKSHTIEIHKEFEVTEVPYLPGVTAYAVDSSPADCVRIAVLGMHKQFDLVLSGINKGLNIGSDIMYSGTVAAVFEAAALGIRAIAFSTEPKSINTVGQHLDRVWAFLQQHRLLEKHSIYNINIPAQPDGIRITRQGGPYFSDDFLPQENGMYLPSGKCVYAPSEESGLDTDAVLTHKHISIMPLTVQRTDLQVYAQLCQLREEEACV